MTTFAFSRIITTYVLVCCTLWFRICWIICYRNINV